MKSILDPKDATGEFPFRWVDSRNTDIRKTFERAKKAAPQPRTSEGQVQPVPDDRDQGLAVAAPNIQSLSLWRKA